MTNEMRSIPQVRRLAEERAEEISNGTLRLDQLWTTSTAKAARPAAEDEAVSMAERQMA